MEIFINSYTLLLYHKMTPQNLFIILLNSYHAVVNAGLSPSLQNTHHSRLGLAELLKPSTNEYGQFTGLIGAI
jgi:hypothetical protein